MFTKSIQFAIKHPRTIMIVTVITLFACLAQFPRIKVDTDPENMLPEDAPVRVFHHETKEEFALYDFVVLGVVNEKDPQGVFNPSSLNKVFELTEEIKDIDGVIAPEIVSLSTKDNIEQAGEGSVRFNWLMESPISTQQEADWILREAQDHPMFKGSIVSHDGKALTIFIPIERKDLGYEVSRDLSQILKKYTGDEVYYITGLPVAEDLFGVEMFKQMAISAPLAGLVIFLLMLYFFRSIQLVIAPMIVAVATVLITMGLLIGFGYPVHIMSSMIPIFLMPIAVLDSVHILSEFFDKYRQMGGREKTIVFVLKDLFKPMLFTSLTSAAGFFSLSFSPIPPVQVFGVFVATGVMIAWVLTVVFIPAYVMLLKESSFKDFGHSHEEGKHHFVDRLLGTLKAFVLRRGKLIMGLTLALVALSIYGITHIQVNDNPMRWFKPQHRIRIADRVLNAHFAGTYEAYLVLEAVDGAQQPFTEPSLLRYVERLQEHVGKSELVGKTTSLTDIVKKVYDELMGGQGGYHQIPASQAAVAQTLISFESSHKPDDLWHVTTPDYGKLTIWFQLKSGDNKDMSRVIALVEDYLNENPPPVELVHHWAGLSYINVIWQHNMVFGMLNNFLGSFGIVFLLMLILFRSFSKALISMVPLTVTILFIYSLLGFFGKDYDMPVAVLSALTLGLSIDFAIHFMQRSVEIFHIQGSWDATAKEMFAGPGRAIVRNALVVAIGFLPLLAAPLIPYKTVGFFMFMIMAVSSAVTLIILPAIISLAPQRFFKSAKRS